MSGTGGTRDWPAYPQLLLPGLTWSAVNCPADQAHVMWAGDQARIAVPHPVLRQDVYVLLHEQEHIAIVRAGEHLDPDPTNPLWTLFAQMLTEVQVESRLARRGATGIYEARDHLDFAGLEVPWQRYLAAADWLQYAGSAPYTRCKAIKDRMIALERALSDADLHVLRGVLKAGQHEPTKSKLSKLADVLARHFQVPLEAPPKPRGENDRARGEREEGEEEAKDAAQAAEQASRESGSGELENGRLPGRSVLIDVHHHVARSATLAAVGRAYLPAPAGGRVKFPRRLHTDGWVFPRKSRGGSLLVDISSSMNWNWRLLDRLVAQLPGAWVAAYDSHTDPERYGARLCILAERGKVGQAEGLQSEREHSGLNGGTGCDLLCMEYMVLRAPGPWVWLSDGFVGVGHNQPIDALMAAHKIPRMRDLGLACKYLLGDTVQAWVSSHMGATVSFRR